MENRIFFEILQLSWQCRNVRHFSNYGGGRQLHAKAFLVHRIVCILLYHSHHRINHIKHQFQQLGDETVFDTFEKLTVNLVIHQGYRDA